MDELAMPHALFHRPKGPSLYELVLVNPSPIDFDRLIVVSGGFVSDDNDIMGLSTAVVEKVGPPAKGTAQIEEDDAGQLDFVIWYELYLFSKSGNFHAEFTNHKGDLDLAPQPMPMKWSPIQETADQVIEHWGQKERRCYYWKSGQEGKKYSGTQPNIVRLK